MKEIAPNSRIWIYQSPRPFEKVEIDFISDKLSGFIQEWNNHGDTLTSTFKIEKEQFIILAVDESMVNASGCSIDSSVRIIKEIGAELDLDFFNRLNVAFLLDNQVEVIPAAEIPVSIESGKINGETLVFNNLIEKYADLDSSWKVPAKTTWLNRYF